MLILLLSCSKPNFPPIVEGELQPQFWKHFQFAMGCDPDHLYAWNKEDTVGIDVFIASPFTNPDKPEKMTIDLAEPGNQITVETGQQIASNFCVEKINVIPVNRVYESTSGILSVEIDHKNRQLGLLIENAVIKHPPSEHSVTIDSVRFPMQEMYSKR
jgi:hypothetical protein